jgi:hypothetical protein
MLQAADEAEAAQQDPALGLRARILAQAADRFLSKLVGLAPLAGETTVSQAK